MGLSSRSVPQNLVLVGLAILHPWRFSDDDMVHYCYVSGIIMHTLLLCILSLIQGLDDLLIMSMLLIA